jgi:putative spermidine/putrescine transport system substrate-binding protein
MEQAGTADKTALAALPPVRGEVEYPTQAQIDGANKVLGEKWASSLR